MVAARSPPSVRAQEQEVLVAKAASPQRILGNVGIHLGHAIVTVIDQHLPLIEHIVDRLGGLGLCR